MNFGAPKSIQNQPKSEVASGPARSFFRFRIPSPHWTSPRTPQEPLLDHFWTNLGPFLDELSLSEECLIVIVRQLLMLFL